MNEGEFFEKVGRETGKHDATDTDECALKIVSDGLLVCEPCAACMRNFFDMSLAELKRQCKLVKAGTPSQTVLDKIADRRG